MSRLLEKMSDPVNKLKLGSRGLELIRAFEGFCPHPYDDKRAKVNGQYPEWKGGLVRGTVTIGYGHTEAAGPPQINRGMRMMREHALAVLDADLDRVEASVRNVITGTVLQQHEFDALVSFHFNTGALTPQRMITKFLNAGHFEQAMQQLEMFRTAKGDVLQGLIRRRAAERALFEGRFEDAETHMQSKFKDRS